MEQKLEVLNEARNSIAMLKARLMGDYASERDIMNLIEDHDKFELAQNALMVTLCQYLNSHAELIRANNVECWGTRELLDYLTQRLASDDKLELDIDTRDVK
jgi:hypothetical protein